MPQLDSLLRIVDQQGADELRLGSDRAPAMFAAGVPKKLTIPATTTEALRSLFGELLDDARWEEITERGRVDLVHEVAGLGAFRIAVLRRFAGPPMLVDAIVQRAGKAREAGARPEPAGAPPVLRSPVAPSQAEAAAPPPPLRGGTREPYRGGSGLDALVARARALGASDLHLADGEAPTVRVDGHLTTLDDLGGADASGLVATLCDEDARRRLARGASVDLALEPVPGARVRINVFATDRGIALAVRLLPAELPRLEALGMPAQIDDLVDLPHGLVVLTGPTGSGKSTTLAALAQAALERRSTLLVTLEDPIELPLRTPPGSLLRRRQIGRDVRDFPTGLRDALREDPDVILIGEMRDPESIALALTAAETGHLVLASLHARGAASAVERIVDACPPERRAQVRLQLADGLRAVVAQRLLPREGGGRVLAAEVLRVGASVASAIRDGKLGGLKSAMQAGGADGMVPLERHLADLVRRRTISLATARAAAHDASTLDSYLAR